MKQFPKYFLASFFALLCLSGYCLAGEIDIQLTMNNGPQVGEVALDWVGGQSPFIVYGSQDPESVGDPSTYLGETPGNSWVDTPLSQGITYYHVVELPPAAGVGYQWSRSYGSAGAIVKPNDVSVDPGNNILLSGRYDGTVDFGTGSLLSGTNNVFLAKFNPDATQALWAVGFDDGQSGSTLISSGAVSDSSGNTYLTGYFRFETDFGSVSLTPASGFDMFLVKMDPAGSVLWAKKYGSTGNQYPKSIAANSSDEIIVGGKFAGSGHFGGSTLTSNGGDEVFLVKLDSDGNHIWSTSFGSTNADDLLDLDAAGDKIAVTGFYKATGADFGGTPLGYAGTEDIFVAKYLDTGSSLVHLFSRGFGSLVGDQGYGVAIDPVSGDVAVTGTFDGSINFGGPTTYSDTGGGVDIFLVKLDSSGNWVGDQGFGSSDTYSIVSRDVLIDDQGDVFITGDLSILMDFGGGVLSGSSQDVFLAKFDFNVAQHLWSERYGGGIGGDVGSSLALNHAGTLLLAGEFWTSINLGGPTHESNGTIDAFIGAFTP